MSIDHDNENLSKPWQLSFHEEFDPGLSFVGNFKCVSDFLQVQIQVEDQIQVEQHEEIQGQQENYSKHVEGSLTHIYQNNRKVVHYTCLLCFRKSKSLRHMQCHVQKVHRTNSTYSCPHCTKTFLRKTNLQKHLATHKWLSSQKSPDHYISKSSSSNALPSKSAVQQHNKSHNGEKPYGCELCGRHFADKVQLRYHMTVHDFLEQFRTAINKHSGRFSDVWMKKWILTNLKIVI